MGISPADECARVPPLEVRRALLALGRVEKLILQWRAHPDVKCAEASIVGEPLIRSARSGCHWRGASNSVSCFRVRRRRWRTRCATIVARETIRGQRECAGSQRRARRRAPRARRSAFRAGGPVSELGFLVYPNSWRRGARRGTEGEGFSGCCRRDPRKNRQLRMRLSNRTRTVHAAAPRTPSSS
jgi:hypothetical protein